MRFDSIHARLLLLTLGVTLAAVVVAALAVTATFQRERAAVAETVRETTRALSATVDRELARREAIAVTLAATREVQRRDLAAFHQLATDALRGSEDWVVLSDRQHQLVNTRFAYGAPLEPRIAGEPFAERPRVSALRTGPLTGLPVFAVVAPAFVGGAVAYNVVLLSTTAPIQRLVEAQRLPSGWIGTVLDQDGRVIARTRNPDRWVGQLATDGMRAALASNAREGFLDSVSLDGDATTTYYATSPAHGWTFAIGIPEGALAGSLARSLQEVGVAALALLLLAALLAWQVGRRIVRPVGRLADAARTLAAGGDVAYADQQVAEVDAVGRALEQASLAIRAGDRALRASEELYRSLGEAVPNFVWASDAEGRALYANRQLLEYTGATLEQLSQRGWEAVCHPDDVERVRHAWQSAAQRGTPFEAEFRYRRHDGAWRWFLGRAVPVTDEYGTVTRWVGTAADITERRETEARARELASLIEGTPDFVAIGGSDGSVRYVNRAGRRMLGIDENADPGLLAPAQLCPDWVRERAVDDWLPQALRDGSARGEAALRTLDGREIPVSFAVLVHRNPRGEVASISTIARDISKRRDLEEQLREESRRKDEFLATLSHELRNPMAPIRYAAHLLDAAAPDTVAQARAVIERQAALMARLLDDLLDVSRVTRGAVELRLATIDLRDVIAQARETVQPLLAQRQQTLAVEVPPHPVPVLGDIARLQQVVGNLLDNASKYSDAGTAIELALTADGGEAVLRVRDHGVGLAPGMVPRLFELFSRVHRTLKVDRGGLGIGLTVVKRLVELHGGRIEVASPGLDRGSTFTVALPLARAPAEVAGDAPGNVIDLFKSQPRTLIVDDNRDGAETLAALLRVQGFPVSVAYDGASALAAFEATRPAVVLLDLGLPDMHGTEVARAIRARAAGAAVRLVALTGWGQDSDRARTHSAGFDLHLVKPVDPAQVVELLQQDDRAAGRA